MTKTAAFPWTYLATFLALMALLAATVIIAHLPLGPWGTAVALGIATAKVTAIALIFMHLLDASPLIRFVALTGLFFLAMLLGLTSSDYLTRANVVRGPAHAGALRN